MTQLGSFKSPGVPSRDELVFQSDIEGLLTRATAQLETRLQQYINARLVTPKDPVVNVTVPTPSVTVQAAEAPETISIPAPIVQVDVEMGELRTEIAGLRADLTFLTAALLRPVTRVIERDSDDLITRVTETR